MQLAFNQGETVHFSLYCKEGIAVSAVEDQVSSIIKTTNNISPTDTRALRTFNIENNSCYFTICF